MFQDTCLKFFSGWIGVMIDGLLEGFSARLSLCVENQFLWL